MEGRAVVEVFCIDVGTELNELLAYEDLVVFHEYGVMECGSASIVFHLNNIRAFLCK